MADAFSKKTRSRIMSAIRKRGNKSTELRLVTIFRQHHVSGWRRHYPLLGNPDFVFLKPKVAVFTDGCFWHGCRWHCRPPSSNGGYWHPKLQWNKHRDRLNSANLRKQGWLVVRLWEHQLDDAAKTVARVKQALAQRR
jgi:DNA mismatch endonuclease, patch repair protein